MQTRIRKSSSTTGTSVKTSSTGEYNEIAVSYPDLKHNPNKPFYQGDYLSDKEGSL
jgi:hypothetical protein